MTAALADAQTIPHLDDAVRRAQSGDVPAFEEIYRAYRGRVHALTLRLSGDPTRAEDLTQDVFIKLWQKLDRFGGKSSFYSWLYRMTVNLVIDRIRSDSGRKQHEVSDEDLGRFPSANRGDRDARMDLEAAVAALPEGARLVLVLHDVEGYRHEDVADMLGIAQGTSKAQLHRARRLLRSMLS